MSDAKLDRYVAAFNRHGFCRWAIENRGGEFLGLCRCHALRRKPSARSHFEIGWRLMRNAWGRGYATEAAAAALHDAFARVGLSEVVSYTAPDNLRSQAVMDRLHLQRDPSRDFSANYEGVGIWHGLVWVGRPA